jgi:hypothetical protein
MNVQIPLPIKRKNQDAEGGSPALTYLVLFMALLLLIVIGAGAYYIRDLHGELRSLHKKLGSVEGEYEKLVTNAEQSVADLRRRMETAQDRQAKTAPDKEKEAVNRLQQAAAPAPAPAPVQYGYRIIQITEKVQQGGQDIIFTRKSNLDSFFGPDEKLDILSTHLYHVWDDSFLLVIYKK